MVSLRLMKLKLNLTRGAEPNPQDPVHYCPPTIASTSKLTEVKEK